jgi:hypothetical protein
MATLTSAGPAVPTRRPVAWAKLAWVSWRQLRPTLAGILVLLAALSTWLLILGLRMHATVTSLGLDRCHSFTGPRCGELAAIFQNDYARVAGITAGALQAVPGLIGVFAGAPLLARELESGTFRFAWTQGCGRLRWALARLLPLAVAVTGAAAVISLLFSWFYQPFLTQRAEGVLAPQLFDLRGVDFAAWTLAAFGIGVLAGVAIRRTVPALAAALAGWAGLDLLTALVLRGHYAAPLVTAEGVGGRAIGQVPWVLNEWWTGPSGAPVSLPTMRILAERAAQQVGPDAPDWAYRRWFAQHRYTEWMTYQPAGRFWHFQLIEGGWLLALALLLGAATLWLIQRRPA